MTQPLEVELTVNGQQRRGYCEPRVSLADFLREELNLTGTHVGCEHGVCGACTILVDGIATRACIMFAVQARGKKVETIEGLAGTAKFQPLQNAFHEAHALQCGFCTPGMLIAALDFLNTNNEPTEEEVRDALSAVLCRCTGYQNIVHAVMIAAPLIRSVS